jgi:Zn-dependent protease with chaperone function
MEQQKPVILSTINMGFLFTIFFVSMILLIQGNRDWIIIIMFAFSLLLMNFQIMRLRELLADSDSILFGQKKR